MHLFALLVDFSHDLLLVGDSCLLLLDQAISDAFELGSHWVEAVFVVLDSVFLLLNYGLFKFIPITHTWTFKLVTLPFSVEDLHPVMVVFPCLSEDGTLLVYLAGDVVAKVSQSPLEFFLESVQGGVHIIHLFNGLLTVLLDLTKKHK